MFGIDTGGGGLSGSSSAGGNDTLGTTLRLSQRSGLNKTVVQGIDPTTLAIGIGIAVLVFWMLRR